MRPEQKRTEESIPISKYGIVLWSWFTGIDPQAGGDTAVREGFSFFLAHSHNRGFNGMNLPRHSGNQNLHGPGVRYAVGMDAPPPLTNIQPGDLVFFDAD